MGAATTLPGSGTSLQVTTSPTPDGRSWQVSVVVVSPQRLRMYYHPFDGGLAVAESSDGLRWHRPSLGVALPAVIV